MNTTLARILPMLALTAAFLVPTAATADPSHYTYTVSGGDATITGYTGPGGTVAIPGTLGVSTVTAIGNMAFSGITTLTSVTIPNSVTAIGDFAFSGCTSLTSINVDPANPSYHSLEGVLFNKEQTWLLRYPPGKTGAYAIPGGVISFGWSAFSGCTSLTSVAIPASVTTIGAYSFGGCTALTGIAVDSANSSYSSLEGVLFNKAQTLLLRYPPGKTGAYAIPGGVTTVTFAAFSGCYYLNGITIPDTVITIETSAFSHCTALPSVVISASVTTIGSEAFNGCTSLTSIDVHPANSSYSSLEGVLFNKEQTSLIQYPGDKPGDYAIPGSVTAIGNYAFESCTFLTSVMIADSVTSIGDGAFALCSALTSVYFRGIPPPEGWDVFFGSPCTIYYLPGIAGWGSAYADRLTSPWLPVVTETVRHVDSGSFGLTAFWAPGQGTEIEAATCLVDPDWGSLHSTTIPPSGNLEFTDPDASNQPTRFYRIVGHVVN